MAGSGMAIALLFVAFAFFQRRAQFAHDESRRLADENGRLLVASREEARTDALTGLPNRRALIADLTAAVAWETQRRAILILFDLDGFKQYNDAFGHPAGDMLLQRLGERLQAAVAPCGGTAYRMGGDEFCVLTPAEDSESTVWTAFTALSERGDGFEVGASYGIAEIPGDGATVATILHVADVRMYDDKATGPTVRRPPEHRRADGAHQRARPRPARARPARRPAERADRPRDGLLGRGDQAGRPSRRRCTTWARRRSRMRS